MKRGRRKGGSKDKVFGCDLQEHLAATNQESEYLLLNMCFILLQGLKDTVAQSESDDFGSEQFLFWSICVINNVRQVSAFMLYLNAAATSTKTVSA